MRIDTRYFASLLVVATGMFVPRTAAACSCMDKAPACEAAWQPGAVFVGNVVSIEPSTLGPPVTSRRVRFAIVEPFNGVTAKAVDVFTGAGGGDCGYAFNVGQTYLVYAYQPPGPTQLATGICSRTRPLSDASDDLDYLRHIPSVAPLGATILGTVHDRDRNVSRVRGAVELGGAAGLTVSLNCEGLTFSATTDPDGRFRIDGVPVGQCAARLENSDYQLFPHTPARITDPRACAALYLQVSRTKR